MVHSNEQHLNPSFEMFKPQRGELEELLCQWLFNFSHSNYDKLHRVMCTFKIQSAEYKRENHCSFLKKKNPICSAVVLRYNLYLIWYWSREERQWCKYKLQNLFEQSSHFTTIQHNIMQSAFGTYKLEDMKCLLFYFQ